VKQYDHSVAGIRLSMPAGNRRTRVTVHGERGGVQFAWGITNYTRTRCDECASDNPRRYQPSDDQAGRCYHRAADHASSSVRWYQYCGVLFQRTTTITEPEPSDYPSGKPCKSGFGAWFCSSGSITFRRGSMSCELQIRSNLFISRLDTRIAIDLRALQVDH